MSVALVMIAKDEADNIGRALQSAEPLIDTWVILDTGSTDGTPEAAEASVSAPGRVVREPFAGFAEARTSALRHARGQADWLLMMDADMTVDVHPEFREWLDRWPDHETRNPDPDVEAWRITIEEKGCRWRMPWLMRGDLDWRFEGDAHAYLVGGHRRHANGLILHHHGEYDLAQIEGNIARLANGVKAGDARSVYYTGWAYKALGRTDEAIEMFQRRARMSEFEEEAWHAQYLAAMLAEDVAGLLAAWRRRPHRHEPLQAAARIVASGGDNDDVLFREEIR